MTFCAPIADSKTWRPYTRGVHVLCTSGPPSESDRRTYMTLADLGWERTQRTLGPLLRAPPPSYRERVSGSEVAARDQLGRGDSLVQYSYTKLLRSQQTITQYKCRFARLRPFAMRPKCIALNTAEIFGKLTKDTIPRNSSTVASLAAQSVMLPSA